MDCVEKEYCYSTDDEYFNMTTFGEVLDYFQNETEECIGCVYWKAERVKLTVEECIDVDSFLEQCDERAYEEIGDVYDNCFADVTAEEKQELHDLIVAWAKKNVKMRYWKAVNTAELKITAEDLE